MMPRALRSVVMRTTLTLDDDVAATLKRETRRSGRSFRDVVNDTLRHGMSSRRLARGDSHFVVKTRKMGALRSDLSLDNVADLIDRTEGPLHR